MTTRHENYRPHRYQNKLGKDNRFKKITGVCAGLAEYYQLPRVVIRLSVVIAAMIFPVVTITAYIVASILLPDLLPRI